MKNHCFEATIDGLLVSFNSHFDPALYLSLGNVLPGYQFVFLMHIDLWVLIATSISL